MPTKVIIINFRSGGSKTTLRSLLPCPKWQKNCTCEAGLKAWLVLFYFNDKASRVEHKTMFSGLRISGMALSNQSDLLAFFSPYPGRWLTNIGQIPAYDKLESQKRIWWNQQPKAFFSGWAIQACRKSDWKDFFNWLSGDWKTQVSHFDWTKPSKKSKSRTKWPNNTFTTANQREKKWEFSVFMTTERLSKPYTPPPPTLAFKEKIVPIFLRFHYLP